MNTMWKIILKTTLFAGVLDILAACLQAYITKNIKPDTVLKYIASGAFGKSAFAGGYNMMAVGLLFHFIIVFACVACFFWLYPKLSFLKNSLWLNACLVGATAWGITNHIVIRLSNIKAPPFDFKNALLSIGILIVCIGLPIAYAAKRHFENTRS
jgi:hypothetical protein